MSDRGHLSIGEVLNLLQDDFPDITISKIRFLESQGLLDPERTPSGYRKFYDSDIARLRWILRQQREHFLPLKVIKDRLAAGTLEEPGDSEPDAGSPAVADPALDGDITLHGMPVPLQVVREPSDPPAADEPAPAEPAALVPAPAAPEPVAPAAGLVEAPAAPARPAPTPPASSVDAIFSASETALSLSVDELARATGLTARQIGELERFGLVTGEQYGTATRYDEEALIVARVAAAMLDHGVEVRHLRMFKLAAEREAAFYEQLIEPVLRQRSPQARQDALDALRHLASGGDALRHAMLRASLKHLVQRA